MAHVPPARRLLRARDLADARYFEPLGVDDLAAVTGLSRAHFSHTYGLSPTAYCVAHSPASRGALVPSCVARAYARPQHRTFQEDSTPVRA